MVGVPSGGDTPSFLQESGETGVGMYQGDVLQGDVKHLNVTFFSGQEWVFSRTQFLPKSQDDSGVAAEERSGLYRGRGLALAEFIPQTQGL